MSVTYPDDTVRPVRPARSVEAPHQPFTPVYARRGGRASKRGVKTWMVLVPVGVLALAGMGALALMSGEPESAAPLSDSGVAPMTPTPMIEAPITAAPMAMGVPTAVPVETAPAASPATQPTASRPAASTARRAPATPVEAPAPVVVETPVEPTGPRPYEPATPPLAPLIVTEPLGG